MIWYYIILYYNMIWYDPISYTITHNVMIWYLMLCYVILYYIIWYYIVFYYIMLYYIILCCVMLCYVILYYIILYYIILSLDVCPIPFSLRVRSRQIEARWLFESPSHKLVLWTYRVSKQHKSCFSKDFTFEKEIPSGGSQAGNISQTSCPTFRTGLGDCAPLFLDAPPGRARFYGRAEKTQ